MNSYRNNTYSLELFCIFILVILICFFTLFSSMAAVVLQSDSSMTKNIDVPVLSYYSLVVLFLSSISSHMALGFSRIGRKSKQDMCFLITLFLGFLFFVLQCAVSFEFGVSVFKLVFLYDSSRIFFVAFFLLALFHAAHLALGMIFIALKVAFDKLFVNFPVIYFVTYWHLMFVIWFISLIGLVLIL